MNGRILIIDDSEMDREILAHLFAGQYDIITASTCEEGMEICTNRSTEIDVVLLDLVFDTGMDGFGFLMHRQEMSYFRDVPVIVITASDAVEDQIRVFNLWATDYISKPFIPEIVTARVNNVVLSWKHYEKLQNETIRMRKEHNLDAMTGILNKTTVEKMIAQALAVDTTRRHALLVFDIDNFKAVNDTYGHLVGDLSIAAVAAEIATIFRQSDIVGRVGGDEFVVLMTNVLSPEVVHNKIKALNRKLHGLKRQGLPLGLSASAGFALSDGLPGTYSELFDKADKALYAAKSCGKAQGVEYGTAPVSRNEENSRIVIISENSLVATELESHLEQRFCIWRVRSAAQMSSLTQAQLQALCLVYLDIASLEKMPEDYWTRIWESRWAKEKPILAVCDETCFQQTLCAMQAGVDDVVTLPLDEETFRRRTLRQLSRRPAEIAAARAKRAAEKDNSPEYPSL